MKMVRPLNELLKEDVGFPPWGSFRGQVRQSVMNSSSTTALAWDGVGKAVSVMREFALSSKKKTEI